MAVIKCKMCGGDLHFEEGATTCECEYCGNTNTLPVVGSDQELNLFNRANHFRMINEFDRAISAYEKILDSDDANAEAHWGTVLSRYGIEYVEDPVSHERIPTCHRVQLTSILSDPDYLAAVEHADYMAAAEYKTQAEKIAQIQKGILAISSQEKPYDVFICYKESDDNGKRTVDSTLAQDIYYGLTESGYRVFFSRITLEDKLGQEYEPYIFAALNSAKVMVVVGTKPEYFNAVWVKNEWSRYLDLIKNDRHRLLIPCYRDMDPYDLPDELSMLQSQDMGKIGFMQDLLRGIRKVLAKETNKPAAKETVVAQQPAAGTTANVQVKRGNMALEDHDWAKADGFFEEALNLDPECAEAYLGKLLAQKRQVNWAAFIKDLENQYMKITSEKLEACPEDKEHIEEIIRKYSIKDYVAEGDIRKLYDYDRSFFSILSCRKSQKEKQEKEISEERLLSRAKQYAKGETKQQIDDGLDSFMTVLDQRISKAMEEDQASIARVKADYAAYIDAADKKAEELFTDGQNRREQRYQENAASMKSAKDVPAFERARDAFKKMDGYKDSDDLAEKCQREIDRQKKEKQREEERQAEIRKRELEQAARKRKTITGIIVGLVAACIATFFVVAKVVIPNNNYNAAAALMENGDYEGAIEAFEALEGYKDSAEQIEECQTAIKEEQYEAAVSLMESGDYNGAIESFEAMDGYKDSEDQIEACQTAIKDGQYAAAVALMENGDYIAAYDAFSELDGYQDSRELMESFKVEYELALVNNAKVGEEIIFGSYEQNGDETDGTEDIEWIVLEKEGGKTFIISKYPLECKPYNKEYTAITWEDCSLREWLNTDFVNVAFSTEEADKILTTKVSADPNSKYNTEPGSDTEDQIFLLSIDEAEKYFSSDEERQCEATQYAVKQGGDVACWWWLRSPGSSSTYAANVDKNGAVYYYGLGVNYDDDCVRPALWINLGS